MVAVRRDPQWPLKFQQFIRTVHHQANKAWYARYDVGNGCGSLDFLAKTENGIPLQVLPDDSRNYPTFIYDHEWWLPFPQLAYLYLTRAIPWEVDIGSRMRRARWYHKLGMPVPNIEPLVSLTPQWRDIPHATNPSFALMNFVRERAPRLAAMEAWICMYRQALTDHFEPDLANNFDFGDVWRNEPLYYLQRDTHNHVARVSYIGQDPAIRDALVDYHKTRNYFWDEMIRNKDLRTEYLKSQIPVHEYTTFVTNAYAYDSNPLGWQRDYNPYPRIPLRYTEHELEDMSINKDGYLPNILDDDEDEDEEMKNNNGSSSDMDIEPENTQGKNVSKKSPKITINLHLETTTKTVFHEASSAMDSCPELVPPSSTSSPMSSSPIAPRFADADTSQFGSGDGPKPTNTSHQTPANLGHSSKYPPTSESTLIDESSLPRYSLNESSNASLTLSNDSVNRVHNGEQSFVIAMPVGCPLVPGVSHYHTVNGDHLPNDRLDSQLTRAPFPYDYSSTANSQKSFQFCPPFQLSKGKLFLARYPGVFGNSIGIHSALPAESFNATARAVFGNDPDKSVLGNVDRDPFASAISTQNKDEVFSPGPRESTDQPFHVLYGKFKLPIRDLKLFNSSTAGQPRPPTPRPESVLAPSFVQFSFSKPTPSNNLHAVQSLSSPTAINLPSSTQTVDTSTPSPTEYSTPFSSTYSTSLTSTNSSHPLDSPLLDEWIPASYTSPPLNPRWPSAPSTDSTFPLSANVSGLSSGSIFSSSSLPSLLLSPASSTFSLSPGEYLLALLVLGLAWLTTFTYLLSSTLITLCACQS